MLNVLIVIAVVGAGQVTGILFIFSNCIMQSLAEMPGGEGMRAMQLINRKIQNPLFFLLFMGTTAVCVAIIVLSLMQKPDGYAWAIAGAAGYIIGPFGITPAKNVPLNNALDRADIDTDEGQALWQHYLRVWVRWNHIRTAIGTAAAVLLAIALV